jgi:polyhydroxybutyrate depolymerase
LLNRLEATYNIDPTRIYANGFSNGGRMAFVLSCSLSHRIAAVGTVAAAQDQPWSSCADTLPIPMISFHGTADPLVLYEGRGPSWLSPRPFPSVRDWTANWARRNRCGPHPIESVVAVDVTRREYTDCAGDAAVVLYTVLEGGHTWPGGKPMPKWLVGTTTRSIKATREMWAFFGEHRLRR